MNPATSRSLQISRAIAAVERLAARSRFRRSDPQAPTTTLHIENRTFRIDSIERGDHCDIPQVQRLLVQALGAEEVDPEEILRRAVEGKTPWGTEDGTRYRIHIVNDAQGKVVSLVAGGLLDLLNDEDNPTGKMVFMVAYAVTLPTARQAGFAREAYISAIIDAIRSAEAECKELSFVAAECSYTSERFWNAMGCRRVYAADHPGQTNSYTELKYVQPALDFDTETGEVANGAEAVPEHFMIDSFGHKPPSKEEVMQTVKAFYRWCNKWPRVAFASDEAYEKHLTHTQLLEEKLWRQLARSGEVIYLDQGSREAAMESGITITGYPAADRVGAARTIAFCRSTEGPELC